jgi:hypothetical protein
MKILPFIILFYLGCITTLQATTNSGPGNGISDQSDGSSFNTSSLSTEDNENKFILVIKDGTLTIKYNKPAELINGEVLIFNLLGQEITRKKLESNNINQVNIPIQNTCYIVKINYSGKVHTQKVVATAQ